jgi:hypothetical protein
MDQGMRIWNERRHLEGNWQVLGARTPAQLEDNLAAGELSLAEDEIRLLDAASDLGAPDYPCGERSQTLRNRRISGGRFQLVLWSSS